MMTKLWWRWTEAAHLAGWAALTLVSYRSAMLLPSASCWWLALIYVPGVNLLLIGIGGVSFVLLVMSAMRRPFRADGQFFLALHGATLIAGLLACIAAASAAAGKVDCL